MGWRDAPIVDEEKKSQPKWMSAPAVEQQPDQPEPQEPATPPEKGYLANLGEYWTKDIPEAVSGVVERTGDRLGRIGKPTMAGEFIKDKLDIESESLPGKAVEYIAGYPERMIRSAGAIAGTAGEASGVGLELAAKGFDKYAGGKPGRALGGVMKSIADSEPVQRAAEWWDSLPEATKATAGALVDVTEALGWKTGQAAKAAGKNVKNVGKSLLGGDMKIKDSLAKRAYGGSIDAKKQGILDNIVKYDLESTTGNFGEMAKKADNLAKQKVVEADALIKKASENGPMQSFVDDIIAKNIDDIEKTAALGQTEQAQKIIQKIMDDTVVRKLDGKQSVEALVQFKRKLDPDGNLFKLGPAPNDADNLERSIRKKLYLDAVSKINEISPEAGKLNKEAKNLWDIAAIASDAASRTSNKYGVSPYDVIMGTGGLSVAAATQNPEAIVPALMAIGTGKAVGQGRGAGAVIKAGKAIEGLDNAATNIAATGAVSAASRKSDNEEEKKKRKATGAVANIGRYY